MGGLGGEVMGGFMGRLDGDLMGGFMCGFGGRGCNHGYIQKWI